LSTATIPPHNRRSSYAKCLRSIGAGMIDGHRGPRLPRRSGARTRLMFTPVTLVAAIALSGCGSSSSSPNADPATVTPASAPLYASIAVKPSGGANGVASSAAKKLTHLAEPYGSIAQALLSTESTHPQYKRDIESWIGNNAGVFISSLSTSGLPQSASSAQALLEGVLSGNLSSLGTSDFGPKGTQGAIVLATSDLSEARSFLSKRAQEQQARTTSYRGVSYQVSSSGAAEGIVKDFAVIGSESGIDSVIDTSLGGASIVTAPHYSTPPAGAVASAYVKPEALLQSVHGTSGALGGGVSLLGQLFAGAQTASVSVTPTANSISVQGEVHSTSGSTPLFGQEGAKALGEMPGGAWLAAGVENVSADLPRAFALLHRVASLATSSVFSSFGGPSIEKLFAGLSSPSAKLQQAFSGWAGSGGMYVSGTGLFNLEAALVIDSNDPSASDAAVGKLAGVMRSSGAIVAKTSIPGTDTAVSVKLQGFPAVIYLASGQNKFVLGLGQPSVQGALSPSSTLSTSASYSAASSALGGGIEPSLIVEFPTLLGFLEGIGLTDSPGISNLVPYLKSLGTLTAGSVNHSGVQQFRLVLGLAGGEGSPSQ
jgi:hypothetical protein